MDSNDSLSATGEKQKNYISLNPNGIPKAAELKKMFSPFINSIGGYRQDDVIEDRIFDTQAVTTAVTNNLTFFANAGTLPTSNMEAAGQLPSQEAFYLTGVKFSMYNNVDAALDFADVKNFFRAASFQLTIANKPYLSGDLFEFLNPLAPLVLNTRYYSTVLTKTWNLKVRQVIPPQVNFKVLVTGTAPTFNASGYQLRCYLVGFRYRSIQ